MQESQSTQIGKEGETVEVSCESFAIPAPSKVTWSVDGKEIDPASPKYGIASATKDDGVISTLTVVNSVHEDFTLYTCTIENSYGSDSATFELKKMEVQSIILPVVVSVIFGAILLTSASLGVLFFIRYYRQC